MRGHRAPFAIAICGAFALATMRVDAVAMTEGAPAVIAVSEPPTDVAFSSDASTIFISLDRHFGDPGGIVAYRRNGGSATRLGALSVDEGVRALAVTPDGSAIVFTTRSGPGIMPVAPLLAGTTVTAAIVKDGSLAGSDQIVVAANGAFAFYTNQRDASLGVARIERTGDLAPMLAIVAHVALDRLPGGIAASPDGNRLYVTSEIDSADPERVPGADDPRLGRTACDINRGPHGVLSVVDVRRATVDPTHAVLARSAAGCAPVRVSLSPRGDIAWVSVRGEDRVLAFATDASGDDGRLSFLGERAVGPEPIGVLALRDGLHLAVVASDGEGGPHRARHAGVTVLEAQGGRSSGATPIQMLAGGVRPREIREDSGGTLWVTDYGGRAVRALPNP